MTNREDPAANSLASSRGELSARRALVERGVALSGDLDRVVEITFPNLDLGADFLFSVDSERPVIQEPLPVVAQSVLVGPVTFDDAIAGWTDADIGGEWVLDWVRAEGDAVRRGDPLAEMRGGISTFLLKSPVGGLLFRIVARKGQVETAATVAKVRRDTATPNAQQSVEMLDGRSLHREPTHRTVVTPSFQLAVKALGLSQSEMAGFIRAEIEANPALEEIPIEGPLAGNRPLRATPYGNDADVYVVQNEQGYTAVVNQIGLPRLRVRGDSSAADNIASARWLIAIVTQRHNTLERVATSVMQLQRAFLEDGANSLRKIALREVGDDVGLHESTVMRVVVNKYLDTPHGVIEMRDLFI